MTLVYILSPLLYEVIVGLLRFSMVLVGWLCVFMLRHTQYFM